MKKVLFFFASVLMLASCENFYIDQNLGGSDYNPTDVRTIDYTLTDADYKSITSYRDNIARAIGLCVSDSIPYTDFLPIADLLLDSKKKITFEDVKDSLGIADATPYYAFAQIATDLAFNKVALADEYVPALLAAKFPQFSKGSIFNITYKNSEGAPEYLTTFAATTKYTLSTADYDSIWGEGKTGTYYLTPATMKQLTSVLPAEAEEGAILAVVYEYKDTEPSFVGGGEEPFVPGGDPNFFLGTPESRGFYTPTEVKKAYENGELKEGDSLKVGGILREWYSKSLNTSYGNLDYYLYDDSTRFEMWRSFSLNSAHWASYEYVDSINATATDVNGYSITVGDTIIGIGAFKYYAAYDVYEFNSGCYIVEHRPLKTKENVTTKKAAAATNGKKTALYQYSGGKWSAYKNDAATVVALPENVYTALGKDAYVSDKNKNVLTTFLAQEYPYAQAGQAYTVVYMNTDTTYNAIEYIYDGATFVENLGISIATATFSLTDVWGSSIYYKQAIAGEGQGKLTIQNILCVDPLTRVWYYSDAYGMCASGYHDDTKASYECEAWLVTPAIDLTRAKTPQLSFDQAFNKASNFTEEATVFVSTNYEGDVTTCEWTPLEWNTNEDGTLNVPAGTSWVFQPSGTFDLSAYVGEEVYIAFRYKIVKNEETGVAVSGTWEIKNLLVAEPEE